MTLYFQPTVDAKNLPKQRLLGLFDAALMAPGRSPQAALQGAAEAVHRLGLVPHVLGAGFDGDARALARALAAMVRHIASRGQPFQPPCVLLSGGDTATRRVRVEGAGRGGRNVEFLLAFGIAVEGLANVHALAADLGGVDGNVIAAGGYLGPRSLGRALRMGLCPQQLLDEHDAHTFFESLGDSLVTGPTGAPSGDFRAILIDAAA